MSEWASTAEYDVSVTSVKGIVDALLKQGRRRGALQNAGEISSPLEKEFEEALNLISEEPNTLPKFLAHHAKRKLSGDLPQKKWTVLRHF
jgi:hypothetical protein